MTLRFSIVEFEQSAVEICQIRRAVFQVEQQVAEALDFDGLDPGSFHLLACANSVPIGTTRLRLLTPEAAKIERVAVLAEYRGQGVGRSMMQQALRFLTEQGILEARLHAQAQTVSFYQQLGFIEQGEPFYEADILHVDMAMSLAE